MGRGAGVSERMKGAEERDVGFWAEGGGWLTSKVGTEMDRDTHDLSPLMTWLGSLVVEEDEEEESSLEGISVARTWRECSFASSEVSVFWGFVLVAV